jgi:hypothetical protein
VLLAICVSVLASSGSAQVAAAASFPEPLLPGQDGGNASSLLCATASACRGGGGEDGRAQAAAVPLLSLGADPTLLCATQRGELSPVHLAVCNRCPRLLRRLLHSDDPSNVGDINHRWIVGDDNGTALHAVVELSPSVLAIDVADQFSVLHALLATPGIDPNAKTRSGDSPIQALCYSLRSNPNIPRSDVWELLELFWSHPNLDSEQRELIVNGCDGLPSLVVPPHSGYHAYSLFYRHVLNVESIASLLSSTPQLDVNIEIFEGRTALCLLALSCDNVRGVDQSNLAATAELLIRHGSNPSLSCKSPPRMNAVHHAVC